MELHQKILDTCYNLIDVACNYGYFGYSHRKLNKHETGNVMRVPDFG